MVLTFRNLAFLLHPPRSTSFELDFFIFKILQVQSVKCKAKEFESVSAFDPG